MITVLLYGHLAERFGREHRFAIASPIEAVRALGANFKGFRQYLLDHSAPGYRVIVGKRAITADELGHTSSAKVIKIVPVVCGSGKGGLQTILGAVIVAVGYYFGQTWMVNIGAGMMLGGVAQMLTKAPSVMGTADRPDNKPSYGFDGAVNTAAQGNPVPLAYGRLIVGSQVISAGLVTEEIAP